jgi:hypothetical protein
MEFRTEMRRDDHREVYEKMNGNDLPKRLRRWMLRLRR